MERIAFDADACHRRIQKTQVEKGVVTDQDRTIAAAGLNRLANRRKDLVQCLLFRQRVAKRMVRVDAVEFQRLGFQVGSGKGGNLAGVTRCGVEQAVLIHHQDDSGDLQQGVCFGVEAAGLDINNHGKKTTKALRNGRIEWVVGHSGTG